MSFEYTLFFCGQVSFKRKKTYLGVYEMTTLEKIATEENGISSLEKVTVNAYADAMELKLKNTDFEQNEDGKEQTLEDWVENILLEEDNSNEQIPMFRDDNLCEVSTSTPKESVEFDERTLGSPVAFVPTSAHSNYEQNEAEEEQTLEEWIDSILLEEDVFDGGTPISMVGGNILVLD